MVLGQGDYNLANFLWDGTRVRIVDFEDSGPSDRAFELAVLVEHISAWSDACLSADLFLALFDLTAADQVKVREYRRLSALFWLMMLLPGSPAHRRSPSGTLERQATRLLLLLDDREAHCLIAPSTPRHGEVPHIHRQTSTRNHPIPCQSN
jgi:thiamine kinase-like enzyme